jgi:hypothetical protein
MTEAQPPKAKQRRIWPFVIAGSALVFLCMSAFALVVVGMANESVIHETVAYRVGYIAGGMSVVGVILTLFFWLIFYFAFFRPRAKFGKALGAFAIMLLAATVVPVTGATVLHFAVTGKAQALLDAANQSSVRVSALNAAFTADIARLNLAQETKIESLEQVASWRARLIEAVAILEAYEADLGRERERARSEAAALNPPAGALNTIYDQIDAALGEQSAGRRLNRAQLAESQATIALLTILVDNPAAWTPEDGVPAFLDPVLLAHYQAGVDQLGVLRAERERLTQAGEAARYTPN